jgi:hypothetical protein
MKRDEEFFEDEELALLYIAKRLSEAKLLEKVLEDAGIDYLVEPDAYRGGILFPAERIGAFFYVQLLQAPSARTLIAEKGYRPYEVLDK